MQQLVINVGGTVEAYFLDRQVASCNVALYNADGGTVVASTAGTVDAVSTTLDGAAAIGDMSVTLDSVSGVVAGRRYLLDGVVPEVVTVKDISGTTVSLFAPLLRRHADGATFKGTRVSLAVAAGSVATLFFDGYAVFTPATGEPVEEVVEVVRRKIPDPLIDESDIYQIIPKSAGVLDAELDIVKAFKDARDSFLEDLGGKVRVHTIIGTSHLRRACALRFWLDRRYALGDQWAAVLDKVAEEYDLRIDKLRAQAPVDADQDGSTNGPNDGPVTSIRVERM